MIIKDIIPEIDYEKHGVKRGDNYVHLQLMVSEPCTDDPFPRPAVLILPGGGYSFLSPREAEPIALAFAAKGFATFVLWYSIVPGEFPAALLETAWSVNYIREHADEFNIIKNKVAVCGFSAGGHLAASAATMWNCPEIRNCLGFENGEGRPDGVILGYPVISTGEYREWGSINALTGGKADCDPELCARISLENAVDKTTSPVFIWHTFYDDVVDVRNSLAFATALKCSDVSCELHVLPHKWHGLSLCDIPTGTPREGRLRGVTDWVSNAAEWFYEL